MRRPIRSTWYHGVGNAIVEFDSEPFSPSMALAWPVTASVPVMPENPSM